MSQPGKAMSLDPHEREMEKMQALLAVTGAKSCNPESRKIDVIVNHSFDRFGQVKFKVYWEDFVYHPLPASLDELMEYHKEDVKAYLYDLTKKRRDYLVKKCPRLLGLVDPRKKIDRHLTFRISAGIRPLTKTLTIPRRPRKSKPTKKTATT